MTYVRRLVNCMASMLRDTDISSRIGAAGFLFSHTFASKAGGEYEETDLSAFPVYSSARTCGAGPHLLRCSVELNLSQLVPRMLRPNYISRLQHTLHERSPTLLAASAFIPFFFFYIYIYMYMFFFFMECD